jgi:hypothetical protein
VAQDAVTDGSSSATVHCTSSPDATALLQVSFGPGELHCAHSSSSWAHGLAAGSGVAEGVEHAAVSEQSEPSRTAVHRIGLT